MVSHGVNFLLLVTPENNLDLYLHTSAFGPDLNRTFKLCNSNDSLGISGGEHNRTAAVCPKRRYRSSGSCTIFEELVHDGSDVAPGRGSERGSHFVA